MSERTFSKLVAGIRFSRVGKLYHFLARDIPDLKLGDMVIVETIRGWQMGGVAQILDADQYPDSDALKQIDRRATPRDLLMRQSWEEREKTVEESARRRAQELRLRGVKVVGAEYAFDGSRLSILFSTESEEKYDLKSLRQDMQRAFQPAAVELRQVGPRDLAKMLCGMGACGMENRCCSQFLCDFSSISIRMAKEQGISLTPTEITGMCGRLRCCLIYEYEQYTQARALLPRKNKRVQTPAGEARVLDQIPLRDAVLVVLMDDTRREFPRAEIQLINEDGTLTPAMSEEELAAYRQDHPIAVPEPEPLPAAAYTLPPQRQEAPERRPREERGRRRSDRPRQGTGGGEGQRSYGNQPSAPSGQRRPEGPFRPRGQERGGQPSQSGAANEAGGNTPGDANRAQAEDRRNFPRRRGGRPNRGQPRRSEGEGSSGQGPNNGPVTES